jgi:L-ascorbate metabolism protein UlaG (beta-lactamase superfamily)
MRVTMIGHATALIELDGTRLLTDPVLRDRVALLRARRAHRTFAWTNDADAVLLSHFHPDHLDRRSLALLDQATLVVGPPGTRPRVARCRLRNVAELRPGDSTRVGSVSVRATRAAHGRLSGRAIGFVVTGSSSLYFAGDTGLFREMRAIDVDVALLPISGWGPTLGRGHLGPLEAVEALELIRPRVAIPIHWGVLHPIGLGRLKLRHLRDPEVVFAAAAERVPDVAVRILRPGESAELP